ncbi:MAG: polymer-forming cytoskeletal protein [Pseudoxanthomonas suwonensis]|nr:polymer-forming cytoskeletal protein [Pseudoxanthomonas suwonensis]
MAIFTNPGNANRKDTPSFASDLPLKDLVDDKKAADFAPQAVASQPTRAAANTAAKESLIASDLSIEGKIEGAGHVRIAGRFKGDVNVQGDLTIEQGAKLAGGVRANQVNVAGELEGNIEQASRVELLASSVVNGDIKAETLTVAAGARIRGHVDCGPDNKADKPSSRKDT